jgi:type I restriction enzyme R subunit
MDEDPAFYEKFSKLIQEVIDLFRSQRITETEYLDRAIEIRNKIKNRVHDDIPEILTANEDAAAYYGVIKPLFDNIENTEDIIAKTAIEIQKILINHKKVHFWDDEDEQKQAMNEIDDYLYDIVKQEKGIELTVEQMDEIIEKALQVARHRSN